MYADYPLYVNGMTSSLLIAVTLPTCGGYQALQ